MFLTERILLAFDSLTAECLRKFLLSSNLFILQNYILHVLYELYLNKLNMCTIYLKRKKIVGP
jgi:hypothetical protein